MTPAPDTIPEPTEADRVDIEKAYDTYLFARKHGLTDLTDEGMDRVMGFIRLLASARRRIAGLEEEREWRAIETAPKDGTWVLILYQTPMRRMVEEAVYVEDYGGWGNHHCWELGCDHIAAPTHWMPRPADPPSVAESIISGLTEFANDLASGVDIQSKYRVTTLPAPPTTEDHPDAR